MASLACLKIRMVHTLLRHVWITGKFRPCHQTLNSFHAIGKYWFWLYAFQNIFVQCSPCEQGSHKGLHWQQNWVFLCQGQWVAIWGWHPLNVQKRCLCLVWSIYVLKHLNFVPCSLLSVLMELTSLVDQVMEMYTCGRYLLQIHCLLSYTIHHYNIYIHACPLT